MSARPPRPVLAVLGLAALGWLGACGGSEPPAGPSRPNIILYLSDTLRQDHLALYGYNRPTSPNLAAFAQDGVTFESAYATSSWTKASTASLLTGAYPLQHGATSRDSSLSADARLLSQRLRPLGYWNAAIVTNPFVVEHWGFDRDYDEFLDMGAGMVGAEAWQHIRAEDVDKQALAALDGRPADKPFFLYVHAIDAHSPNNPPEGYAGLYSKFPRPGASTGTLHPTDPPIVLQNTTDMYDSEISYLDHEFGQFIAGLKQRGLYENSVIWFVSDHGEELLDHGYGGHGQQLYQESVRVPLLLHLPGGAHAGARVTTPVSLIDVAATLMAMVGESPGPDLPGADVRPVIAGNTRPRPLFFDLNLVSGSPMRLHVARGVLLDRFKYFEDILPEPGRFLFDLKDDPQERTNLLDSQASIVAEMSALLTAHRAQRVSGVVLRAAGDKRTAGRELVARVTTEGRFVEVNGFDLDAGDEIRFEPGAQEFTLHFRLAAVEDNVGIKALRQDIDSVNARVEPPGARVTVESFTLEGLPNAPILLGLARQRVTAPVGFAANDPALAAPDVGVVFHEDERLPSGDPDELPLEPGLYVVNLPGAGGEQSEIPADIMERLKALGYVSETPTPR